MLRITETLHDSPTEHCESLEEALSIDSNAPPTTTEQLTLFTEGSHARTSAAQGNRKGLRARGAVYGTKCSESSQNADPVMLLLRTCVEQSISPSIPCTPVWSEKVTKSTLTSFLHLRLVRHTKGKGCSSSESGKMWPTPTRRDYKGDRSLEAYEKCGRNPATNSLDGAVKVVELCGLPHSKETTEAETNPIPSEPPENVSLDGA